MTSGITLANVRLVITGELGGRDPDDVRWDLIARGASVMTSVTKTTGALIAGADPNRKLVDKARQLGVPVLDLGGLSALLAGASLAHAVAGRAGAGAAPPTASLAGKKVAIRGAFVGFTKASLGSALERLGATVVSKPSKGVDLLVVGEGPTFDAIEAMDAGVPFLRRAALDALLAGAPLAQFVGAPAPAVADPQARVREILDGVHGELVGLESGERWDETLTVTVRADGRVSAELRDLGGTPLHDHVREVIQRQSWPKVSADCTVAIPIVFS